MIRLSISLLRERRPIIFNVISTNIFVRTLNVYWNLNTKINDGRMKSKEESGVRALKGSCFPIRLKGKFYDTTMVRLEVACELECWATDGKMEQRTGVAIVGMVLLMDEWRENRSRASNFGVF